MKSVMNEKKLDNGDYVIQFILAERDLLLCPSGIISLLFNPDPIQKIMGLGALWIWAREEERKRNVDKNI